MGIMTKHPDLSQKHHAEYINRALALISEEKIRNWFKEVSSLLCAENLKILENPSRVWNCDKTAFFLAPKGSLVLAELYLLCEISTMAFSTQNTFRWPKRPDKIWYTINDIVKIISSPVKHNGRGFYKFNEMEKFLPSIYT